MPYDPDLDPILDAIHARLDRLEAAQTVPVPPAPEVPERAHMAADFADRAVHPRRGARTRRAAGNLHPRHGRPHQAAELLLPTFRCCGT